MKNKSCPNCGSMNYIYGYSNLKFVSSWVTPETVLAAVSGNYAKALVKANFGLITAFYNQVIQDIPSTALLRCQSCKCFILPCPSCNAFLLVEKYANIGDLFECNKCKGKMSVSETDSSLDTFVKY